MPPSSLGAKLVWNASPLSDLAGNEPLASPALIDATWMPLGQPWETGSLEPNFQPGWARIRWNESGLHYEAVFMGAGAKNSTRKLNERAWELGDVGEVFLQAGRRSNYLEVHITPENCRLQLLWSNDGIPRVRNKAAALEAFMIGQPDWVHSQTLVRPAFWSFHAIIPACRLGLTRLRAGQLLRTAVCRYHYRGTRPVLSSTAPLAIPFFHHRENWHRLLLAGAS